MFIAFLKKLKNKFSFKIKLPSLPKIGIFGRRVKLHTVWKKFLGQIPPTFRHFIQSYPSHFLVMGDNLSGKTQLIQKSIDQERDVYSFETTFTIDSDIQFYMGQKFIIQEISWALIEDRSIRAKKELTHLWRKLYAKRDPILVVTFNPSYWEDADSEKINHHARLLLNKISLLSHIIDKPITIRVALTHTDKIEGYSQLAHILRIYGLALEIPLVLYDNNTLKETFQAYEEYLPLVLKSSSAEDYLKVLNFIKKLSELSFSIDQFIRSLTQKDFEKKLVNLDKAYFVSNQEIDINSDVFDCQQNVTPSVFIKRHYFKHEVMSVSFAIVGCCCVAGLILMKKQELVSIRKHIALLERYQSSQYLEQILPSINPLVRMSSDKTNLSRLDPFFFSSYKRQIKDFVEYSRDYVLMPTFQKILLKKDAEIEMVYFLGLTKASKDNRLGQLILENSKEWGEMLGLPQTFIESYVNLCKSPQEMKPYVDNFTTLYLSTPLTDYKPWTDFFKELALTMEHPATLAIRLDDFAQQASRLLTALERLRSHSLTTFICKILQEEEDLKSYPSVLPKIQLLQALRDNCETLDSFLKQVQQSSLSFTSLSGLNIHGFLTNLNEFLVANTTPNTSYHFILGNQRWVFESSILENAITSLKTDRIIEDYITENRETGNVIFFKHTGDLHSINLSYLEEVFPALKQKKSISGFFTKTAYERNIYPISHQLAKLNDSKLVSFESKNDLNKFVAGQVESYAREYKKEYQEVLELINFTPDSLEQTKKVISYMIEPLSQFTHFLQTMKNNLNLPVVDSLVLQPIHYLTELQFFKQLLPDEMDKPGELLSYQAFLRSMLHQLREDQTKESDKSQLMGKYLSPVARFSLAIFDNGGNSSLTQMGDWLQKASVPAKYQSFFINPIMWVHDLGLRELKSTIEDAWEEECLPIVQGLLNKFPFNPNSKDTASLEEINSVLHPSSELWKKMEEIIGTVSVKKNGKWEARHPNLLKLDDKIYATVNALSKTERTLWDPAGNPQPLHFKIRTVPFGKTGSDSNKYTILSYLITKNQSVYNINQQPEWEELIINWWEPEEMSIGLEMMDGKTNKRSYLNIKVGKEFWNVFQLLKKAKSAGDHNWKWDFADKDNHEFALYFNENPWQTINPLIL